MADDDEAQQNNDNNYNDSTSVNWESAYTISAAIIFAFVSYTFLFPCNWLIPLDRRTVAVVGSVLCYLTRTFAFNGNRQMDMYDAIDFDVLILLPSIMVVNHVVVHLKETRKVIDYLQSTVQNHPRKGFWLVSLCAFLASPFLTNDGVCLLFVEPILHAFDSTIKSPALKEEAESDSNQETLDENSGIALVTDDTTTPTPYNSPAKESSQISTKSNSSSSNKFLAFFTSDSNSPSILVDYPDLESTADCAKEKGTGAKTTRSVVVCPSATDHIGANSTGRVAEEFKANNGNVNESSQAKGNNKSRSNMLLEKGDAIYFLLALACSSNIGSALTYTGNPQNMIVATDAVGVLPPYKFLLYMLVPSVVTWIITIAWIERCWFKQRSSADTIPLTALSTRAGDDDEEVQKGLLRAEDVDTVGLELVTVEEGSKRVYLAPEMHSPLHNRRSGNRKSRASSGSHSSASSLSYTTSSDGKDCGTYERNADDASITKSAAGGESTGATHFSTATTTTSEEAGSISSRYFTVTSPAPYAVFVLLAAMIVMIFVDVIPISTLVCISSIVIVVFVVVGNQWMDKALWVERVPEEESSMLPSHKSPLHASAKEGSSAADHNNSNNSNNSNTNITNNSDIDAVSSPPRTAEDKQRNLNEFFEGLFNSIDYSLLLIFLGTFIIVENLASTGIPKYMWSNIVGNKPFKTISSVFGISLFVVVASQCLGNVAVIQLAKPNVHDLDDDSKRMAWAVLSFVATVGGNLTVTGSAANIIVAEKARRLDASMDITFFKHAKVCFWVTVLSCVLGGALVALAAMLDSHVPG